MVNVQDIREFKCQQLNRDVWSNEAVRNIVQEHFILWQVSTTMNNIVKHKSIQYKCKSDLS